jgi:hypothetical protein
MERPNLITAVGTIQFLLALLLAGLTILVLMQIPEAFKEPDATDTVRGLKIGALALGIPAFILFFAIYGLWKAKLWGGCLALLIGIAVDGVFIYNVFEDGWGEAEQDDVMLAVCFAIFPILLLLPKVVRFYWKGSNPQLAPVAPVVAETKS